MAAQVLIDVDGNFNKDVARDLHLADENCRVGAVSVVGVQGTGKSTLLNSCFSTKFPELDTRNGMARTTKGICIAVGQSPQNAGHEILVLDIEGTDGMDRGQKSDNAFESQTALFALAMSNTVIFNMKCDSVNLHQGSSSPLMETVFQVMLRKFSTQRHINLLFVLHDRNMCPLEVLRLQLIKQLTEIWDRMSKAPDTVNAALEDYFKIEVLAMPHYRLEREEFDSEVVKMRERIFSLVKLGELDSASGFIALAERNWMDIKEDKILNLPLNRITVSEAFCVRNVAEKFLLFRQDKKWLQIQQEVKSGIVEGFGNDVSSILDHYLLKYEREEFDSEVVKMREQIFSLVKLAKPTSASGFIALAERNWMDIKEDKILNLLSNRITVSEVFCAQNVIEKFQMFRQDKDVEQSYLSLVKNMRDRSCANFQKEIVEKIRKGCSKFEKSKRDECITQFESLLPDAHIKQANWDYTHEQLGILKSDMASNEEAAAYIIKIHKEIKEMNTILWSSASALGVIGIGALIGIGASLSGIGGLAATAAATGVPTASSIYGFIPLYGSIQKKELELKEACKRDPTINALVNQI